jgi:preprotein translocase subunit SecF
MRFIKETNIPFLSYRWYAIGGSCLLILGGLAVMFLGPGLNLGIDFAGGTQVTLKFHQAPDLKRLRHTIEGLNVGAPVIQRFDEPEKHEILIRVENPEGQEGDFTKPILDLLNKQYNGELGGKFDLNTQGRRELTDLLVTADPDGLGGDKETLTEHYQPMAEAVLAYRKDHGIFASTDEISSIQGLSDAVRSALLARCTTGEYSLLGAQSVGPAVGADLREKAQLAILFSLVGMLVYIWIRFQLPYGVGAVVALFHDVLITLGALALTQREINLPTVAALLTLVGYSVNDTVVVFDRVRENLRLKRGAELQELMDESINQTLSRTLITSGTTLVVVVFLYLFGGDVINTFAFVLLVGIIVGTYSSIFIASPVALGMTRAFAKIRQRRREKRHRRR